MARPGAGICGRERFRNLVSQIVLLPRSEKLRETRSDHQFATAKRFEHHTGIFIAWQEDDLGDQISKALAFRKNQTMDAVSRFAPPAFTDRIRAFMLDGSNADHPGDQVNVT